jgi:hypothetical protein
LTPNLIRKVLSTLETHRVEHLLMGGQACVLYGVVEFSRDLDIVLLADPANLDRLQAALDELEARCIAVPPFSREYLDKGHAVHFRCHHPDAQRARLDVMSRLRGVDPFPRLWQRRTTLEYESGWNVELLALPDLVRAKKTQRDKDWPTIRLLVERHYRTYRDHPAPAQIEFWLRESRTVAMLIDLAHRYPEVLHEVVNDRPLLGLAVPGSEGVLENALYEEERHEREADRRYWQPLKQELEQLRLRRSSP